MLLSELEDEFNQLYEPPLDFGILSIQELLSMLQYQFQVFFPFYDEYYYDEYY